MGRRLPPCVDLAKTVGWWKLAASYNRKGNACLLSPGGARCPASSETIQCATSIHVFAALAYRLSPLLEKVLCRKLEVPCVRRVLGGDDQTTRVIYSGVCWVGVGGSIEQVEGVHAELEILLAEGLEVLEYGHVGALRARPMNLV